MISKQKNKKEINNEQENVIELIGWPKFHIKVTFGAPKGVHDGIRNCINRGICDIEIGYNLENQNEADEVGAYLTRSEDTNQLILVINNENIPSESLTKLYTTSNLIYLGFDCQIPEKVMRELRISNDMVFSKDYSYAISNGKTIINL
jgi:hypothetical protein